MILFCFVSFQFNSFLLHFLVERFQGDLNDILLSNQLNTKIKFRIPKTFKRILQCLYNNMFTFGFDMYPCIVYAKTWNTWFARQPYLHAIVWIDNNTMKSILFYLIRWRCLNNNKWERRWTNEYKKKNENKKWTKKSENWNETHRPMRKLYMELMRFGHDV